MLARPEQRVTVAESMLAYYGDAELMRVAADRAGTRREMGRDRRAGARPGGARESQACITIAGDLSMPGAPPDGAPVPPDGRLPACVARPARARSRSGSMCMSRSAPPGAGTATSTPTPRRSWAAGRPGRATRAWPSAEIRLARQGARAAAPRGQHRVLRRRDADAAAAWRPGRDPARDRRRVRARRRRRGHHRGQPGERGPAERWRELRAAGFTRISLGMQSAAEHVLGRPRPRALARPAPSSAWPGRDRPASRTSAST